MSLRTETSSYNMRYLLHLINVYVVEDVPFCPGLVGTVVKLIEEKVKHICPFNVIINELMALYRF